nr:P1 family peptidase [Gracilimonas sp.]
MHIGIAEYEEGPTGTTVFYFPEGVIAAADIRGGSPGTVNAPAVSLGYEEDFINAVVFSGGSWHGLSAATGAADAIKEKRLSQGEHNFIAGVLGGIIYDVGNRRFSRVTPDHELGAKAFRDAVPNRFPLGARGAGRFAMQGIYYYWGGGADHFASWPHSGQGAAFRQVGPTKIAVFTVVNSLGTIVDRDGRVVRCHRNDTLVGCPQISELITGKLGSLNESIKKTGGPTSNTTLTLVVTNQKLPYVQLQRLAMQVHTSMGRAIQPFATDFDGDVLYTVTTDEVENPDLLPHDLAFIASELAWDAVLNSLPTLPDRPKETNGSLETEALQKYAGTYEFPGGSSLAISADAGKLTARYTGMENIYFDEERTYRLIPAGTEQFIIQSAASDVIRFDLREGEVTGLTLNPGPWRIRSERIK